MLLKNDLEDDIAIYLKERLPKFSPRVCFDVGANLGWFSYQFLKQFDSVEVYCFEPVKSIFNDLKSNLSRFPEINPFPRCHLINSALGNTSGTAIVTATPNVTVNRIVQNDYEFSGIVESCEVFRGDDFCKRECISEIDYLKIDAEGSDLDVLMGFKFMLSSQSIKFIQLECSFSHRNTEHVNFMVFSSFLQGYGYSPFRLLTQASPRDIPLLTRGDLVFISDRYANSYNPMKWRSAVGRVASYFHA